MNETVSIDQSSNIAATIWGKYQSIGGKVFAQFIKYIQEEAPVQQGLTNTLYQPGEPESNRVLLVNAARNAELQMKAITDPLTGVWNRRHMALGLEDALKSGNEVHFAIIDLDHFKEKNDLYDHSFGDIVLQEFTRIVSQKTQDNYKADFGRWGGEEFVLLFNKMTEDDVMKLLDEIKTDIESNLKKNSFEKSHYQSYEKDSQNYTISIGISKYDPKLYHNMDEFILSADKAVYTAKQDGRNRISHSRNLKPDSKI